MNRPRIDKLTRRLATLEQRRPDMLPTVEICIVEPGEDGPIDTGERWRGVPGGGFVQVCPAAAR